MQALGDEQRIDSLEKKIDEGFARVDRGFARVDRGFAEIRSEILAARSDARSDFRTLIAVVISMWVATALTVLAAHF